MSYDRPEYLFRVLTSLRAQISVHDKLFLFQDGGWDDRKKVWKTSQDSIAVCARIFQALFPLSPIFSSSINLGVAGNYRRAESFVFEAMAAEEALFLEDDLVLGENYLDVTDQMLALARESETVGYVAAYGDLWSSLEKQKLVVGQLRSMHENWGAAMTRKSWLRQRPIREKYWDLVRDVNYEDRNQTQITHFYESLGYEGMTITSQDGSRWIACAEAGMVRLTTSTCHARYIGEKGVHFTPEHYGKCDFSKSEIFEGAVKILPPSMEELHALTIRQIDTLRDRYRHEYLHIIDQKIADNNTHYLSIAPEKRLLMTYHKTVVAYDMEKNCCVGSDCISDRLRPILIDVGQDAVQFFMMNSEDRVDLIVTDDRCLAVPTDGETVKGGAKLRIHFNREGLSFSLDGTYLSCEPSGRIICDRSTSSVWECFNFKGSDPSMDSSV